MKKPLFSHDESKQFWFCHLFNRMKIIKYLEKNIMVIDDDPLRSLSIPVRCITLSPPSMRLRFTWPDYMSFNIHLLQYTYLDKASLCISLNCFFFRINKIKFSANWNFNDCCERHCDEEERESDLILTKFVLTSSL